MNYILAIDQGTSSTRAMIYTVKGELIATSQYPLTQYYPKHGWVEHDPEEIWNKTTQAMNDVINQVDKNKIIACGITNQRETTLVWSKLTGKCLYNAIVWQDRRTHSYCDSLKPQTEWIKNKTGLVPDAYFSATKLRWILDTIPHARELADKDQLAFGTIDTFLLWRLTQGEFHSTDVTNASRTLLFNIFERKWDEELLDFFSIPCNILPEVKASDSHFGTITTDFVSVSVPITAIAGDQQAALIGQRCFTSGMIKATYGTGGFLLMNTGDKAVLSHDLLTTIAYEIHGKMAYGLEGSLYQAGTIVKWLRDELKIISSASQTEDLAQSLTNNDGVYLLPAFTGLGAPHWINTAGAAIVGISRTTNRAHFARAALECVCYLSRELLTCMREDSGLELSFLRVDGGMAANNWMLQFLADQCNVHVQKPFDIETTALGIAMLASLASSGETLESVEKNWRYAKNFSPQPSVQIEIDFEGWQKAVNILKD